MSKSFNKNDYLILEAIIGNECTTPVMSFTINQISKESNFSEIKVRLAIKSFQMYNYIKEGSKDGNNKTYYVTDEGIKHYMSVMNHDDEDIRCLINRYNNESEE